VVGVWFLHSYGIVGSWFIPVPFVILFANTLIFKRFMPVHIANSKPLAAPITRQQIFRSVTGDHIGSLLAETCVRLLPLLVLNIVSKSANAYFSQAWLVATVVYLIATNMATSFAVEVATDLKEAAIYSRQMLKQMALLIVPLAALIAITAPLVLSLFGADYARHGTTLLRLLAIAALPIILNNWYLSYVRVLGDVKAILLNQGLLCVLTLSLSYWWLTEYGIIGIGMAWLVAQSLIALIVVYRTAPMLLMQNRSN
jgi:O-antigen/teichoic acid export membrane protein